MSRAMDIFNSTIKGYGIVVEIPSLAIENIILHKKKVIVVELEATCKQDAIDDFKTNYELYKKLKDNNINFEIIRTV